LEFNTIFGFMKSVTESEWRQKAEGLAEWRKNRTSAPNLDLYRKIVSLVQVGESVLDVGCGQCHLFRCLPDEVRYTGIDPFPLMDNIEKLTAEELNHRFRGQVDTVFMLAALDNVKDLKKALKGLRHVAVKNIVILTSIGVPPDKNHTVQVDREDLVSVLGEPSLELMMLPKTYLFEWVKES
jgi:SAM-dependent methyltransferase